MPKVRKTKKRSRRRTSLRGKRKQTGRGFFGMSKSEKDKLKSWKANDQSYRELMDAYNDIGFTAK